MKNTSLVSIVVITYNSAQYVIETLDSIKYQTYKNIELIISDDCSKDNTVELCRNWLEHNHHYFARTKIITTPTNTGIPANCNRGLYAAEGEWIKFIAGDDALLKNCIEANMYFANQNNNIEAIYSKCRKYQNTFDEENAVEEVQNSVMFCSQHYLLEKQHKVLMLITGMEACTLIYRRDTLIFYKGFDESIRNSEDWALWLKLSRNNVKFHYLEAETVKYRLNETSVFTGSKQGKLFPTFYKVEKEVFQKHIKRDAIFLIRIYWYYLFFVKDVLTFFNLNKPNLINSLLYRIFMKPTYILRDFLLRDYQ